MHNAILRLVRILFIPLAITSCSQGNPVADPSQPSQQNDAGDVSMFDYIFNSKCREAVSDTQYISEWKDSYNDGAKTASVMFHQFLKSQRMGDYSRMQFVTTPVPPYYFMEAHLERELSAFAAIDIEHGVVDSKSNDALEAFVKHIKLLDTTDEAKHLAQMIFSLTSGITPDMLVTEYEKESFRAEQLAPSFTKNPDGSVSLVFDSVHTGRSVSVYQSTLQVTPDYKVSFSTITKQKNK